MISAPIAVTNVSFQLIAFFVASFVEIVVSVVCTCINSWQFNNVKEKVPQTFAGIMMTPNCIHGKLFIQQLCFFSLTGWREMREEKERQRKLYNKKKRERARGRGGGRESENDRGQKYCVKHNFNLNSIKFNSMYVQHFFIFTIVFVHGQQQKQRFSTTRARGSQTMFF